MIDVFPKPRNLPEPVSVLVAEDEVLVRLLLADALREAGFRVLEAANAEQVIAILNTTQVDVVVTDLQMRSRKDGLVVAQYAHQHHPDTPVLLTSITAPPADGSRFDAFFIKPYKPDEIVAWIKRRRAALPTHTKDLLP
jgi:CheY-like chemotaxis protein